MLLGIAQQTLDTVGQLVLINLPVAESAVIRLTRILHTKPTIVHHEEFATHRGDVAHHLVHTRLIDVHVDTFPGVEQDLALLVAMSQLVVAAPLVEVAAYARESLLREAQGNGWCSENLTLLQMILGVVGIDACEEIVEIRIIRLHLQLVVAAIDDGRTNHVASILLTLAVEREHHLAMGSMGIAHTILILDNLLARSQRLLTEDGLVTPRAVE